MKKTAKKLLSIALVLVMVLSLLPTTVMAASGTETDDSSSKPSVADAFGFKTDPPAGFDASDGVHPFSQSGTNDTINMVPVKEVGLLTGKTGAATYTSTVDVYNFNSDNRFSFSDASTKLFPTQTYTYKTYYDPKEDVFRLASGVAYDPTGSGRDDHVFYYGTYAGSDTDLLMQDYSYEGGEQGTVASDKLSPGGNASYDWSYGADNDAPDKYLSVTAGNFNGNGKETVVLYDPQYGNFTLQECTLDGENIQASPVFDLGNEITVKNKTGDYKTYTLNEMVTALRNVDSKNYFPKFMPLVQLAAGDLDGDEKDELVVTVTPIEHEYAGYSFDCYSWVLIFNKENDGAGNAVWKLKTSKVFNEAGAASVIGDFDNNYKNELVLVGDLEIVRMEYSDGQLTTIGTTSIGLLSSQGVAIKDNDVYPIYSVPSVGAVRLDGTGTSPYLFTSGKLWRYVNGGFIETFDGETSTSYILDNLIRRQPIIGNFDGNTGGREQLFVAVRGTKGNGDYIYGIECFSAGEDYSYTESDADALGRMVLAAPDADTDDGMVMRYTGKEYVFSDPEVMAVLMASPYFEDLLDDYENAGTTGFGTSSGTGSSFSNTVTNTVGAYVTYSADLEVFGIKVYSYEFEAAYNYEWSKTNEVSHTYTTSINYEAGSGSNQVVMVATPVTVYHYDVLGLKGQPIATSNVSVPEAPCYTVMSVEDYNASAELLGNPVIDNRSVVGVVPGQPQTYPSSKWQINSVGGVTVPFDTPVLAAQGNAVISQEVSWEDSQTLTKSYSHNVDVKAGAGAVAVMIGATYGYSNERASSEFHTSSVSRSGSVANVPAGNPDYSFKWQFATWDIRVGGYKVPVMGYIVTSVSQPPSVPQNLTAAPDTDSVTLEWEPGYNSAVKYDIFRYYPDEAENYQYDLIGTVDGTETSFVCDGLNSNTRYYFSIRSVGDKGLRSKYAEPVAVTTISPGQALPKIQYQPVDRNVNVANTRQTTFSTLATPSSGGTVTYAWECREDSSSAWETITAGTNVSGYNSPKLTLYNITDSMHGTQYRCRVSERSGAPYPAVIYTGTATLTVGKSKTTTTLLSPYNADYFILGREVTLCAGVEADDNQACVGNVSFLITNTASGVVTTLIDDNIVDGKGIVNWKPSGTGVYTIKAAYAGDDTTETSTSKAITCYVQESSSSSCKEIALSGDLVYGSKITPTRNVWLNGTCESSTLGVTFRLYYYNGTEFTCINSSWKGGYLNPGEYRVEAILYGNVSGEKTFTVSKRPITITAPSIPSIIEGDSLNLTGYVEEIEYSYNLETEFKNLFTLNGVSAKQPLSGQYDISVVYANPNDPVLSDFLCNYQPTFEKSVFTVLPSSAANLRTVAFSAGVNGSLKAFESTSSTREITSSPYGVSQGSTVFFSPEAAEGFTVSGWTINGMEVTQEAIDADAFIDFGSVRLSGNGLIVEGIQRDVNVKVEFTNLSYTVKFSGYNGGSVTAIQGSTELSSPVKVCGGSSVTFTAESRNGVKVVKSWQITRNNGTAETKMNPDGTVYTGPTLTLENIDANLTVKVEFEDAGNPLTVTYGVVDENGKPTDGGLVTVTTEGLDENGNALKGSTVKLTANAKPGTAILRWEVYDGNAWVTKEASTDEYTIYSLQSDTSVRVVVQPNSTQYMVEYFNDPSAGSLTVKTGERDISSGSYCTAYSTIIFTYVESEDYEFVKWHVDGTTGTESSNGTTHTYTISALNRDTFVSVNVDKKPTVTVDSSIANGSVSVTYQWNGESVTPSANGYVHTGTVATVTATPNDNYVVKTITANGTAILTGDMTGGAKTADAKTIDVNTTFAATFLEKPKVTIGSVSNGSVKVTLNGSDTRISSGDHVDFGSTLTFTAAPATGYRVKGWYSDAACTKAISGTVSGQNSYTIEKMVENAGVYVAFEPATYTITFDTDGGTTINPITKAYGTAVTAPTNPTKTGYTFDGWDSEIPETMPAKNVTITAKWKINHYIITFDPNGGVCDTAPLEVEHGSSIAEMPIPTRSGYDFVGWYDEYGNEISADTVIDREMTVTAQWKEAETVIGDIDGDGKVSALDLVRLQQHIFGLREMNGAETDLNGDGKTDTADLVVIQLIILGIG